MSNVLAILGLYCEKTKVNQDEDNLRGLALAKTVKKAFNIEALSATAGVR